MLVPTAAMAKGECKEDKQKFCKDVAKSDLGACFDKHVAELSEACKAKRDARAKEKSAKMGKEAGTHTEPGHGEPSENDTSKVQQPERQNPTTGSETPKQ